VSFATWRGDNAGGLLMPPSQFVLAASASQSRQSPVWSGSPNIDNFSESEEHREHPT
jgi:hypothetical protein